MNEAGNHISHMTAFKDLTFPMLATEEMSFISVSVSFFASSHF
jgi:hypothetical protein